MADADGQAPRLALPDCPTSSVHWVNYRIVVWREAGNYGPAGSWVANTNLGTHSMPYLPEFGDVLVIRGEEWKVTDVQVGYCHVRPVKMILS